MNGVLPGKLLPPGNLHFLLSLQSSLTAIPQRDVFKKAGAMSFLVFL